MSGDESGGEGPRVAKRSRDVGAADDDILLPDEQDAVAEGKPAAGPAAEGAEGGAEPKVIKVRRARPKLTVEALLHEENGLPSLPFQMARKRWAADTTLYSAQVMQAYEEWAKRLFPASKSFTDFLNRFDKFATAHFKEEVYARYAAELVKRRQQAEERASQQQARRSGPSPAAAPPPPAPAPQATPAPASARPNQAATTAPHGADLVGDWPSPEEPPEDM